MEKIPTEIQNPYVDFLKKNRCPDREIPSFIKWLQYYLDFCHKYSHSKSAPESLDYFLSKLKQKHQTDLQIEQAKQAITLFYKLFKVHKDAPLSLNQKMSGSAPVTSKSDIRSNRDEYLSLTYVLDEYPSRS